MLFLFHLKVYIKTSLENSENSERVLLCVVAENQIWFQLHEATKF